MDKKTYESELHRLICFLSGQSDAYDRTILPSLTPRQHDVFALLVLGYEAAVIGIHLSITERTVDSYIQDISKRLCRPKRVSTAGYLLRIYIREFIRLRITSDDHIREHEFFEALYGYAYAKSKRKALPSAQKMTKTALSHVCMPHELQPIAYILCGYLTPDIRIPRQRSPGVVSTRSIRTYTQRIRDRMQIPAIDILLLYILREYIILLTGITADTNCKQG